MEMVQNYKIRLPLSTKLLHFLKNHTPRTFEKCKRGAYYSITLQWYF